MKEFGTWNNLIGTPAVVSFPRRVFLVLNMVFIAPFALIWYNINGMLCLFKKSFDEQQVSSFPKSLR